MQYFVSQECKNSCCNATTCKLNAGAQCAEGECCHNCKVSSTYSVHTTHLMSEVTQMLLCKDISRHSLSVPSYWSYVSGFISVGGTSSSVFLSSLKFKPTGSICRPKAGDCDLTEYCTGLSAACPTDAFTQNGLLCNRGRGYCYNGQCPSRQEHCQKLWGRGEMPRSDSVVYKVNTFTPIHNDSLHHCLCYICVQMLKLLQMLVSICMVTAERQCSARDALVGMYSKATMVLMIVHNNSTTLVVFAIIACGFWLQRSILWNTFLFRWKGVSCDIRKVLLQCGKWSHMQ